MGLWGTTIVIHTLNIRLRIIYQGKKGGPYHWDHRKLSKIYVGEGAITRCGILFNIECLVIRHRKVKTKSMRTR